MRTRSTWARLALAALAAYLLVVALNVFLRRELGVLDVPDVSASPRRLVNGELGRLLTSGLIVNGPLPVLQLLALIAASGVLVVRQGVFAWWRAALLAHVGSALLVYAGIALAVWLGSGSADAVGDSPDFGISCAGAGVAGALTAGAARRRRGGGGGRADRVVFVGGLLVLAAFVPFSLSPYGSEHLVAYGLGALAAWGWGGAGRRPPGLVSASFRRP